MARLGDCLTFDRGPEWSNRVALAPLTNQQSNNDGTLHDDELRWLAARATGGFATVMTGAAHVSRAGQAFPGQLGVWSDEFIPGLTRVASSLRERGSRSVLQLHHGGARARQELSGVSVRAPWTDVDRNVLALSPEEIGHVVGEFAAAAARAELAGFDGVEIHGAHGYLLAQFLDKRRNARADAYGGSLENRSRIIFEVLEAVRSSTSATFQVGLRLSPERYGVELSDSLLVAAETMRSGLIDYLDMSLWDVSARPKDSAVEATTLLDRFAALPRGRCKLGVAGKLMSGDLAQECLDAGVDFVLIGTAGILHHDFATRVIEDQSFRSIPQPVSGEHLAAQAVGPAFIEYLSTQWDDFVA
ncbi:NADH:flavin oxidoreductase [Rhodococcus sp. 15-1154-1]|nr:NADH:flavin oxidoreductase [Rhodococcus sp. 15-1154-1]OZF07837.1 NADH:flavin oxidoreductase [Rhodococcus sp. 15-1154-1]